VGHFTLLNSITTSLTGAPGSSCKATRIEGDPNRAAAAIALGTSVNPAAIGQTVTITAAVFAPGPGGGNPTGTVTFKDGNAVLGSVTIGTTGVATFTTSFATAGSHAITAV
jgi:hypothetical protein